MDLEPLIRRLQDAGYGLHMQDPRLLVDIVGSGRPDIGGRPMNENARDIAARIWRHSALRYQEWGPLWVLEGHVRTKPGFGSQFQWKTLRVGINPTFEGRMRKAKQVCIANGVFQPDPVAPYKVEDK
jgi:hypothetical protein